MQYKDYYKIMGVKRDASADDIKRAYRKLARKYHPDVSKEADADAKFKEVGEAYEVLKDPEKRKAYDQFGENWQHGQDFQAPPGWQGQQGFSQQFSGDAGQFSEFFEQFFGGSRGGGFGHGFRHARKQRGQDINSSISISLSDAYHGTEITVQLASSDRRQAPKAIKIKVPKGVTNGQQIRLAGLGGAGLHGGAKGDLLVKVNFSKNKYFSSQGKDVYLQLPITPWEAALGASINVPTLGQAVTMKIPAGSQSGQKFRLKGKGLPGKVTGDQFVVLNIVAPSATTDAEKAAYEAMANAFKASDPREAMFAKTQ